MRKLYFYFLVSTFLSQSFPVMGQQAASVSKVVKEEKGRLLMQVTNIAGDSDIVYGLSGVIDSKIDLIQHDIATDGRLTLLEKEKALRSLVYFMKELGENIAERKLDIYEIPGTMDSYEAVLQALLHQPGYKTY